MIIKVDKSVLMKGQPITPGWYKGKTHKPTSEIVGDKVNLGITLTFEDQMLSADERSVDHTFYNALNKGVGFLVPYIAAILRKPIKEIADGLGKDEAFDFDFDLTGEKDIQFKLTNEPYQGRLVNKIEAWLPYDAEPPI